MLKYTTFFIFFLPSLTYQSQRVKWEKGLAIQGSYAPHVSVSSLHTLSLSICVCIHGGEAYLACYHFLNDLCFQPMMDCIALIDINFPEPGKKKLYSQEEHVGTRVIP